MPGAAAGTGIMDFGVALRDSQSSSGSFAVGCLGSVIHVPVFQMWKLKHREEASSLRSHHWPVRGRARLNPSSERMPTAWTVSASWGLSAVSLPPASLSTWRCGPEMVLPGQQGSQAHRDSEFQEQGPWGHSQHLAPSYCSTPAGAGAPSVTAEELAVWDSDCVWGKSEAGEQREPFLPM